MRRNEAPAKHWGLRIQRAWNGGQGDKQKKADAVLGLWSDMQQHGLQPEDSETFNVVINGLKEGRHYQEAKDAFETMIRSGLHPKLDTYMAMMGVALESKDNALFDAVNLLAKSQENRVAPEIHQYLKDNPADAVDIMQRFQQHFGDTLVKEAATAGYTHPGTPGKPGMGGRWE